MTLITQSILKRRSEWFFQVLYIDFTLLFFFFLGKLKTL